MVEGSLNRTLSSLIHFKDKLIKIGMEICISYVKITEKVICDHFFNVYVANKRKATTELVFKWNVLKPMLSTYMRKYLLVTCICESKQTE